MVYFWGEVGFELLGLGSDVVASLVERADQGALHGAFDGCDTIIHLAADGRPSASSSGKSSCFNVYLSPPLSLSRLGLHGLIRIVPCAPLRICSHAARPSADFISEVLPSNIQATPPGGECRCFFLA